MYDNLLGVGGLLGTNYWSSTERDADTAWLQLFHNGYQNYDGKDYPNYVRPVRTF
jgi:hypothetical protein